MNKPCIVLAAFVLASTCHAAETYRCTTAGHTTYSDQPCGPSAAKITVMPSTTATPRATQPGQRPNRYATEADSLRVPAGLQCDKQADAAPMQQLAQAYDRFEEIRSAASAVPRASIGSALFELMRARDAVQAITAKSPCGQAISAAASRRAELSYQSLKMFAAGDRIEHLNMETVATYAGIHYAQGRKLYGF